MIRFQSAVRTTQILFPSIATTAFTYQIMKRSFKNITLSLFLLAFSVFLDGCCRTRQAEDLLGEQEPTRQNLEVADPEKEPANQIPAAMAQEKEPLPMIQIQKLSLTDKTLNLNYRLSNPFDDDIWVCYDIGVYGKQEVQGAAMRIDGETVRIQIRCNIDRFPGFQDPAPVAKYVRLQPGESCSGKVVRDLPMKDYVREFREERKEHKEIVLHRAIFEVGYFGPKWNKFLDSLSKESKKEKIKPKPQIIGSYYYLSISPLVIEETMDGQLFEVMYILEYDSFVKNEEFAEVVVTNVAIPCSVVVDDK